MSQHSMIHDMHLGRKVKHEEMAAAAGCGNRWFGTAKAHPDVVQRRRRWITPVMLNALCEHLIAKPGTYLYELSVFLSHEFAIPVSKSSIRRVLNSIGWSKKEMRHTESKMQNLATTTSTHFQPIYSGSMFMWTSRNAINKLASKSRSHCTAQRTDYKWGLCLQNILALVCCSRYY